jgi:hypothetical protein
MLGLCLTLLSCALAPAVSGPGTHVLVITGVSGDPKYEQDFYDAGKKIVDAMRTKYGVPDSMITFLAEHPEKDAANIRGQSTKAEVEKAFAKIKTRAKPGDLIFVVLIGHGSSQDQESSVFNLVGSPDMNAQDFEKALEPFGKEEIVFVNTSSASGGFLGALAGKNRVVITSTMSPMERNYAKFSKHFAAAFSAPEADTDKNGKVSILEAYNYARTSVGKEYNSAKLLQSEHSRLDDNGDGHGAPPSDIQGIIEPLDLAWFPADGRTAARIYPGSGVVAEESQVTTLYQEHADLMKKLLDLPGRKATMDPAAYESQLQAVLADLVVTSVRARWVFNGGKL